MTTRCRPHRPRRPGQAGPDLDPDQLGHLLDGLLAAWSDLDPTDPAPPPVEQAGPEPADPDVEGRDGWTGSTGPAPDAPFPLAVGVVGGDPTEVELAVRELDGPDPVSQLYGFVAPPSWTAFGVVAPGRVHPVADLAGGPNHPRDPDGSGPDRASRSVVVGLLVSRRGHQVSATRGAGRIEASGEPAQGRLPDACRRALGLPTAPPEARVLELWSVLWLERVLASRLVDPRACSWDEVAWSFPGCGPGSDSWPDARSGSAATDRLRAAAEVAQQWTWRDLRRVHAAGHVASFGVHPADAAWMDDGMFSREALGGLPRLDDLVVELRDLLAPSVVAQLERALLGWGLA